MLEKLFKSFERCQHEKESSAEIYQNYMLSRFFIISRGVFAGMGGSKGVGQNSCSNLRDTTAPGWAGSLNKQTSAAGRSAADKN
jgi:hypothetical protein